MNTCIGGGVGGAVIVDGADGGGRGVARHSDVSIARPAARRLCPCLVPARARRSGGERGGGTTFAMKQVWGWKHGS